MDKLKNLKHKKVFVFPFSKTSRYVLFCSTAAEIWKHANSGSVTHLLTSVTNVCIRVIYTSVGEVKALVPQVTVTVPNLLKLVKTFSVRAVPTSTEKYSTPWIIGQNSGANPTGRAVAQLVETLGYKPERSRVIGIFHWQNTSGRTTALWSTQPLNRIELSKDNDGRCVGLTTSPPTCWWPSCNLGDSNTWNPQGLHRDCFLFYRSCGSNNVNKLQFGSILLSNYALVKPARSAII
jgi:hypothetical protein